MDYKIQQRNDKENVTNNRFNKQNNNFARASHLFVLYISLPFLHYWDVKMPNFAYYGEFKQATTKWYFSISELGYGPLEFNFRRVHVRLTK